MFSSSSLAGLLYLKIPCKLRGVKMIFLLDARILDVGGIGKHFCLIDFCSQQLCSLKLLFPKSFVAFKLQSGIRPVLVVRLSWPLRHLRTRRVSKSCGSRALSRGNYPQDLKESVKGRVLRFLQYSMTGTWFHYHSEWKARARLTVLL
ncbi:hypothetical protein Acr_17g0004670 [Actinidia rufa]|uniref:Uncharacterized protein n=1 Tax=Actinidia rufa TaxID=165716 RepID=A0A7J0G289_9ERIC|nr:hypothetical protein Acr_17g0004670 [Actinidia rufa]